MMIPVANSDDGGIIIRMKNTNRRLGMRGRWWINTKVHRHAHAHTHTHMKIQKKMWFVSIMSKYFLKIDIFAIKMQEKNEAI